MRQPTRRQTITNTNPIGRSLTRLGAAGISLLMLIAAAPASAQLGGDVRPGPKHGDWQIVCEDTPAGESCFITQAAVDDDGDPVMQVSVGLIEGEPLMVVYLPLGLDLRPGMLFQVGETLRREFRFQTCIPTGCRVVARLDEEMLAAMRGGTTFRIGVRTLESDRVGIIEGSLMGFTAGYQAVSQ